MIRMILLGTTFIGFTAALLIFQPGADTLRREPVVSRAQTELETLAASASATSRTAVDLTTLVRPSEESSTAPSRAEAGLNGDAFDVPQRSETPAPTLSSDVSAPIPHDGQRPATAEIDSYSLQVMTRQVLANINSFGHQPQSGKAALQALVAQSMRQEESDAYLDALLNDARDRGKIEIPGALITADNRVDTATLLASFVQHSAATAPKRPSIAPGEPQTYTVQPGDSLASISYRFYGETYRYTVIFEANRDSLEAPDKIRVGQKLTIPVL